MSPAEPLLANEPVDLGRWPFRRAETPDAAMNGILGGSVEIDGYLRD